MARKPKLNLIIGGTHPTGPGPSNGQLGGQLPKKDRLEAGLPVKSHNYRSKKAYTGTVAGNGRPQSGRKARPGGGPKGPAGLPFRDIRRKPSLMTRIGRRLNRLTKFFRGK